MTYQDSAVVLDLFAAIERRDAQRILALYHPQIEFCWPPSLPYGGATAGLDALQQLPPAATWGATWGPLQPTDRERRMDPRLIAVGEDGEVVVHYHQRGVAPTGERFDGEVLGLYRVRDGRLARAQMFYFDTVALRDFLARATGGALTAKPNRSAGDSDRADG